MTKIFCDANVVLKWFHSAEEAQVAEARALIAPTGSDRQVRVLDLTYFEVGNALARGLAWGADRVAETLNLIARITGEPVRVGLADLAIASELAVDEKLSFYDAAYWAASLSANASLATMDKALLRAGAGETPAQLCGRLGLEVEQP